MVYCTQYVVGRWSGNGGTEVTPLPDHQPAKYWVQYTTSCIAHSKAPEGGQNCYLKHVKLNWIYQKTIIVASSWLSLQWLWFIYRTPVIIKCGLPLTHDSSSYFWKLLLVAVLCCMFVCKPYSSIIPSTTQNSDVAFSFHNILFSMSFAGYHCWKTYHRYNNQWHVGTKMLQSTTVLLFFFRWFIPVVYI